jgi:2-(1,2-epoxy-1,2-dihydrophenyl)acetyl-CoA isomerase
MPELAADPVVVERHGAVALVRLNEPATLNALSATMKAGLAAVVPRVLDDAGVKAVVLTGTGRAFCAGGDIRGMTDTTPVQTRARMAQNHAWMQPLLATDKPIVAAVNGLAVGAGLSLTLAGDFVIAAESAKFLAGFAALGAAPDLGLCHTLPRIVGLSLAREMLILNRALDAGEAVDAGLVLRVRPADALVADAMAVADGLTRAPYSVRLTKAMLRRCYDASLAELLDLETQMQSVAYHSADFKEGATAFLEKRRPIFSGDR